MREKNVNTPVKVGNLSVSCYEKSNLGLYFMRNLKKCIIEGERRKRAYGDNVGCQEKVETADLYFEAKKQKNLNRYGGKRCLYEHIGKKFKAKLEKISLAVWKYFLLRQIFRDNLLSLQCGNHGHYGGFLFGRAILRSS